MLDESIKTLHENFQKKKQTLALAESCTGGAIAAHIVKQEGASNFFLGSIVAYSNEMKIKILNVDKLVLEKYGAVSEEVSRQMAQGTAKICNADWGLAVTGIMGPDGGTKDKPVGTVHICIVHSQKEVFHEKLLLTGSRENKILLVVSYAIQKLNLLSLMFI